jgi:putative hydrolase of the HAD superfamily
MNASIQVIAFDADDTLWVNEPYFQEIEHRFCSLMEPYMPMHSSAKELFRVEMQNLALYGYGIKAFVLSMIEAAMEISDHHLDSRTVAKLIDYGKEMLEKPIELLDGVEQVLNTLQGRYKLVVATKGDLLDQERKLKKSGLESYFHHIEIMSEKKEADYLKLIRHLDIEPSQLLMIGNSLKSDVLPVLEIGGYACHVPYHTTWAHERVDVQIDHPRFKEATRITEVLDLLA